MNDDDDDHFAQYYGWGRGEEEKSPNQAKTFCCDHRTRTRNSGTHFSFYYVPKLRQREGSSLASVAPGSRSSILQEGKLQKLDQVGKMITKIGKVFTTPRRGIDRAPIKRNIASNSDAVMPNGSVEKKYILFFQSIYLYSLNTPYKIRTLDFPRVFSNFLSAGCMTRNDGVQGFYYSSGKSKLLGCHSNEVEWLFCVKL